MTQTCEKRFSVTHSKKYSLKLWEVSCHYWIGKGRSFISHCVEEDMSKHFADQGVKQYNLHGGPFSQICQNNSCTYPFTQ